MAAIQINLSKRSALSLVNVHAPTATHVAAAHVHLDDFNSALGDYLGSVMSSLLVLVAGDFNAKLGRRDDSGVSPRPRPYRAPDGMVVDVVTTAELC